MNNYINEIAKIEKKERFDAITNQLKMNGIGYIVQSIPGYKKFGNIIVQSKHNEGQKIVASAHYDNFPGTPGANDNASACSILLNLIFDYKNSDKNIEFVFFDLEEQSCVGSNYYMSLNHGQISYAINLEMCGIGKNILFSCYNLIDEKIKKLNDLVFKKYNAKKVNKLPPGDAYTFINSNVPTFYIVNSTNRDLTWYEQYSNDIRPNVIPDFSLSMHQPNDTVDKINIDQVKKIYSFVFDLLRSITL
ncbi:MAG: M28 family peptidase [Candidatus Izemoplasmatales bacterium]|nr:M28 family peptidase [Candidatus Izemoplasmatales bacterium]